MSPQEETFEDHRRKVIKWLSIGFAVLLLVVVAIVVLGNLLGVAEEQQETIVLSDEELDSARNFASNFIAEAGTFGLSSEAIASQSFDFVATLTSENGGRYENPAFGLSRGERYQSLERFMDVNGTQDFSQAFIVELDEYYPDWSGQLSSYTTSDVLVTPGAPYRKGDIVLLPMQVSFTSDLQIYRNTSPLSTDGTWELLEESNFVTVQLLLSQQSLGTWSLWSTEDVETTPYVLATWSQPDWRAFSPNPTAASDALR